MSVVHSTDSCNPTSTDQVEKFTPEHVLSLLEHSQDQLRQYVAGAAASGLSFDCAERRVWEMVREAGFLAMELLIRLQGNGDVGEKVETAEGKTLQRSCQPIRARVRSIFGQHSFEQFTYSQGRNRKVELYPISARMQLPEQQWSYLLQEFSQLFAVDQAFNQAAKSLETIWGAKFSVDTLEQVSRRMGEQADKFLDELPTPSPQDEGPILVASADCKGVPLIKNDSAKVPAFETAKKRPGNRRMATVASVYSVSPYERTAEDVVAALFRDARDETVGDTKRPKPRAIARRSLRWPNHCVDSLEGKTRSWVSLEKQSNRNGVLSCPADFCVKLTSTLKKLQIVASTVVLTIPSSR